MAHRKRYFIAVRLLDEDDKPTDRLELVLKPWGLPWERTYETDDFEAVSALAAKLREEYPEQSPVILEAVDP